MNAFFSFDRFMVYIPEWFGLGIWCLTATFDNITVISWRSVLLVEETGVVGESY